jgi:Flp pilus assembly protein TadB
VIAVVAVLGAAAGLGLVLTTRALRPTPPPLAAVLAALDPPTTVPNPSGSAASAAALRLLEAAGAPIDATRPDLVVIERAAADHALRKLATAVAAATVFVALGSGLAVLGASIGPAPVAFVAAAAAAGGFVFPDLALREEAARRRRAFRHALSAYLDLVNVILAGGGGIDSALHAAAEAGDGPAFAQLRHALARARLTGRSPWDVFAELGARLNVPELAELAASVSLAGTHGARIRLSLAAKADALRGHQQAEVETEAESATERMTIPVAILLFGFLVFIAYPALVQITSITQTR